MAYAGDFVIIDNESRHVYEDESRPWMNIVVGKVGSIWVCEI